MVARGCIVKLSTLVTFGNRTKAQFPACLHWKRGAGVGVGAARGPGPRGALPRAPPRARASLVARPPAGPIAPFASWVSPSGFRAVLQQDPSACTCSRTQAKASRLPKTPEHPQRRCRWAPACAPSWTRSAGAPAAWPPRRTSPALGRCSAPGRARSAGSRWRCLYGVEGT